MTSSNTIIEDDLLYWYFSEVKELNIQHLFIMMYNYDQIPAILKLFHLLFCYGRDESFLVEYEPLSSRTYGFV